MFMKYFRYFLAILVIGTVLVNYFTISTLIHQHYADQAQSFLHGHTYLNKAYPAISVIIEGKHYWPLGPFPSVLLMPFQLIFGSGFNQWHMQLALVFVMGYLLFTLAKRRGYDTESSGYLTFAFLFASFVIGLIVYPNSWFFSHIIAMTALLGILLEWDTKKRPWLLGLLTAAIAATRPSSAFIFVFLLWMTGRHSQPSRKWRDLFLLCLPVALTGLALLWFNWARFGNPLEMGYNQANITSYSSPQRDLGLFGLQHIPSNIYYYFLISVKPITEGTAHLVFPYVTYSTSGLSLFLCAPFFFLSLKSWKDTNPTLRGLWAVTLATFVFLLCYYHNGWVQFGPRYAADFFPIVYVLLLYGLKGEPLKPWHKNLIIGSACFNTYVLLSTWLFR